MSSVQKKLLMAAGAARKQEVLKMIENSLTRIGLSANSAKVYLACIGLGTVPVMRVVEQVNLPKATVYDALERLKSEGLIKISSAVRNRTATAVDPSVLELHESRRQRLRKQYPSKGSLPPRTGQAQHPFL
jgi:sugar-specific transcriptional regulator TrmB